MKRTRLTLSLFTALMAAATLLSVQAGGALGSDDDPTIRWDIVRFGGPPPTILPGGMGSAFAADNSKITLTGSGTFQPGDDDEVTGGGTWRTFNPSGTQTGSGTYRVTGLVAWHVAPGTLPPGVVDTIGDPEDARAGLAVLQIRYRNGGLGTLIVSCHLVGSPDSMFEGITASKSFTDYFDPDGATATLFHELDNGDD